MQQIIQYISDNLAAIILIWQSLFIALSGACELFGWTKLSKFFGTTAALDLGRVLRYLRLITEFAYASKKNQAAKSIAKASLVVFLAALSGCSLEAARQARVNSQLRTGTYSAPVQARPERECRALDDVHIYTAYGAEISLGVGTAAGVLAAADTSTRVENAAIGTGIGAAVVAAGLGYWSQKSSAMWTEQCSQ